MGPAWMRFGRDPKRIRTAYADGSYRQWPTYGHTLKEASVIMTPVVDFCNHADPRDDGEVRR